MRKLIVAVLTLILAGGAAWFAASRVESPDQIAARAEAPPPDPVVAPLDRGFLQGPVSMSTTAQHERTVTITPPSSLTGVVTFAGVPAGETLRPGSVLFRANGRPVFVLSGAFALYRDLLPGATGDDVAAVQAGLQAAGYSIGGDRSGSYGWGTQSAIRRMYKNSGYTAPEASPAPAESDGVDVSGPRVLMTEIMIVADLPAFVQAVAPVGTQLASDTQVAILGAGRLVLSARLPSTSIGALAVGATATFVDDAGAQATGQVAALTPDEQTAETVVTLTSTSAVTAGTAYVLTIANPAAETGESLLAPAAAVVSRGGRSYVYPRVGETFQEVEVQVTGAVGGVAAIVPVDDSVPLDKGTEVRIG